MKPLKPLLAAAVVAALAVPAGAVARDDGDVLPIDPASPTTVFAADGTAAQGSLHGGERAFVDLLLAQHAAAGVLREDTTGYRNPTTIRTGYSHPTTRLARLQGTAPGARGRVAVRFTTQDDGRRTMERGPGRRDRHREDPPGDDRGRAPLLGRPVGRRAGRVLHLLDRVRPAVVTARGGENVEALFRRYGPELRRHAARFLHGTSHDPDDVLQEVTLRALARHGDAPLDLAHPRAWLHTCVQNACLSHLRSARSTPPPLSLADEVALGDQHDPHTLTARGRRRARSWRTSRASTSASATRCWPAR